MAEKPSAFLIKSARQPHYFCGVYDGKDNEKLWQEVYDYLEETYDLSKVKKVYLNSDGGAWINGAKKRLSRLTRVLDKFHMNKYMLKITRGLLDSADEVREDLLDGVGMALIRWLISALIISTIGICWSL